MKKPDNYRVVTPSFTPVSEGVYLLSKPYDGKGKKLRRKHVQRERKRYYEQFMRDRKEARKFDALAAYGPIKSGAKQGYSEKTEPGEPYHRDTDATMMYDLIRLAEQTGKPFKIIK